MDAVAPRIRVCLRRGPLRTLTRMRTSFKSALVAGLAALVFAGAGHAASTVTFEGASYTLEYSGFALPDLDSLHETFRISLNIDTNTYSGGGSFLDNVAIKVSSSVVDQSLFSAPGGVADWTVQSGGLNANGCSGSGSGFVCANGLANLGKGVAVTTGNGIGTDYSLVFDITLDNGALFTDPTLSSIKARYVDGLGEKAGDLLGANILLVPEPEIYAMMVVGLGLVGFMARRRKQKKAEGAAA